MLRPAGDFIGVPPSHDEWLDNLDAIPGTTSQQ